MCVFVCVCVRMYIAICEKHIISSITSLRHTTTGHMMTPDPAMTSFQARLARLHRPETAKSHVGEQQTMCRVMMRYHGWALNLARENMDPTQDVVVEQQHCGGNTLTVFKDRLTPGSECAEKKNDEVCHCQRHYHHHSHRCHHHYHHLNRHCQRHYHHHNHHCQHHYHHHNHHCQYHYHHHSHHCQHHYHYHNHYHHHNHYHRHTHHYHPLNHCQHHYHHHNHHFQHHYHHHNHHCQYHNHHHNHCQHHYHHHNHHC